MGLMKIDPGLIIWTLFIFGLLLLVLGRFVWKPILEAVRKREERIRESLEQAEQVQAEASRAMAEQKVEMEAHRQQMTETIKRAKVEADRAGKEALEKAKSEAAEMIVSARRQIEEERNKAVEAVRVEAVEIALAAASHLMRQSLDKADHKRIVDEYLKGLPTSVQ